MAKSIVISGNFAIGNVSSGFDNIPLTDTITVGDNIGEGVPNSDSGSWQAFDTSSISTLKTLTVRNEGSGSVKIAMGSTPFIIAHLEPGEVCHVPWSGSNPQLYHRAVNSATSSIVKYKISEPF